MRPAAARRRQRVDDLEAALAELRASSELFGRAWDRLAALVTTRDHCDPELAAAWARLVVAQLRRSDAAAQAEKVRARDNLALRRENARLRSELEARRTPGGAA